MMLFRFDPMIDVIAKECTNNKPLKDDLNALFALNKRVTIIHNGTIHLTDEALDIFYHHKALQWGRFAAWLNNHEGNA